MCLCSNGRPIRCSSGRSVRCSNRRSIRSCRQKGSLRSSVRLLSERTFIEQPWIFYKPCSCHKKACINVLVSKTTILHAILFTTVDRGQWSSCAIQGATFRAYRFFLSYCYQNHMLLTIFLVKVVWSIAWFVCTWQNLTRELLQLVSVLSTILCLHISLAESEGHKL